MVFPTKDLLRSETRRVLNVIEETLENNSRVLMWWDGAENWDGGAEATSGGHLGRTSFSKSARNQSIQLPCCLWNGASSVIPGHIGSYPYLLAQDC